MIHELVNWSSTSEQCDVQKFVEKYGRYVPLLVRIADGYAGRDESCMHLFSQNEVSQSVSQPASAFCMLVIVCSRVRDGITGAPVVFVHSTNFAR